MVEKYKYVHVFWRSDLKFNPKIVAMIYNMDNKFVPDEHLFVTPYVRDYNYFLSMENVNKHNFLLVKNSLNLINKLENLGDWFIIHGLVVRKTFFINKQCRKKIIWRTWGGDTGFNLYNDNGIRLFIKKCLNCWFKRLVSDFKAIGIAKVVDVHNIHKTLGIDKPFYVLGYTAPRSEIQMEGNVPINSYKTEGKVNVLIGHNGEPANNHIALMNALTQFSDKIQIFLILSYGYDKKYIAGVKNFVKDNCFENVTIIDNFMPRNEYMHFLDSMDIAILDAKGSYALGNIALLVSKKKKLFFNEEGVLHQTFLSEGIPHCCTNEISKMTFEEFSKPLEISDEVVKNLLPKSYEYHVAAWHKLLDDLDKNSAN